MSKTRSPKFNSSQTMKSLPLDAIVCCDVVKGLPLPDACIDVVCTSPPYYGLRDYGVRSIFGSSLTCKHIWDSEQRKRQRGTAAGSTAKVGNQKREIQGTMSIHGSYCSKCGAWKGQLGLEPHPQMFINHLVDIFREIRRVLKPMGSVYVNLGDTYYGGGQGGGNKNEWKGKEKKYPHLKHESDGIWLRPKQLLGIPWRVAIAMQNDGWLLRNAIIWNKFNHMPSSVKDRYACGYEFVFFFVKSQRYFFDLDAIREPHKAESLVRAKYGFHMIPRAWNQATIPISGGKNINIDCHPGGKNPGDIILESWGTDKNQEYHGDGKHNPMGQSPSDLKRNIVESYKKSPKGKNPGDVFRDKTADQCKPSGLRNAPEPGEQHAFHEGGKNPGDFWSLTTEPFTGFSEEFEHFAVFPESLMVRPLIASCPKGGIVLDPFCGRGTVGKVAKGLGLHYILMDAKPEYCELARLYISGQKYKLRKGQKRLKTP